MNSPPFQQTFLCSSATEAKMCIPHHRFARVSFLFFLVPSSLLRLPCRLNSGKRLLMLCIRSRSSSCTSVVHNYEQKCMGTKNFSNPQGLLAQFDDKLQKACKEAQICNFEISNSKKEEDDTRQRSSANKQGLIELVLSGSVSLNSKKRLRQYSQRLRNCASKGSLNETKAVHGQVIVKGIEPDSHLWVSLLNACVKSRSFEYSLMVFDKMPKRDIISWTALLTGFAAEGYGSDGINLFIKMRKEGVIPNEFTLATALKASSMCNDLDIGMQLHAEITKIGVFSDIFVGSALVDLYSKCAQMELALGVFCCIPQKNVVSWNALLKGYSQMDNGKEVIKLFCRMTEPEIKFSKFTLSTVLKGCANSGNLIEGRNIHSLAIKFGREIDDFVGCTLLDMYSKFGMVDDALNVFLSMKYPDIVAWSSMITCFCQQGKVREATKLFCLMRETGVILNQFTLASLLTAATDLGDLGYGGSIHACVCKYGFDLDSTVGNTLVMMYLKTESIRDGYKVFELMINRDQISWNVLICCFLNSENSLEGQRIFKRMLEEGFKPNTCTFINILTSCSSLTDVNFGKQVHTHVVKNCLDNNQFVGTALIGVYAKSNCLKEATSVFSGMVERDLFTWNALISGFSQTDQAEKAMKYFVQMQREGLMPNEFTLASCLSGCSYFATLESGQQLHSLALKGGHIDDVFVGGALVDMYLKCGCIEHAESIFRRMVSRDTVSWNIMIHGYARHGLGEKGLQAFKCMIDEGLPPDDVTFTSILLTCSRMGLVEEGKKHFNSLIAPTIEHYACMVNILGRAGRFDEVGSFIEKMKLAPTSLIWETVLGACNMHGNVELGEMAAKKLLEVVPEMDYSYILLSNIYASRERWDDVRKIRASMSGRCIKKEPGCSWVHLDGQVHVFHSQDCSHPSFKEIHLKLEELSQKLTSVGYVPKTEYVLHKVSDGERKGNLLYHSERLALAFTLARTTITKPIRIYKNFRICGDCHDVMKLISDITNREIIVRDVKSFHHFKNRTCSCGDYW